MMEARRLRCLQHNIESLGANEHTVLLEMITAGGVRCARNSNGYFCDLAAMPEALVERLCTFVAFSLCNNQSLERHDRCMHDQLQLLQRVPSSAAEPAAPPGGRGHGGAALRADAPAAAPPPTRGAKMAFFRRAGDAPRRRGAADAVEELDAPLLMQPRRFPRSALQDAA